MLHLSRRLYDILSEQDVRNAVDEEIKLSSNFFYHGELDKRHDEIIMLYEIERKINKLLLTKDERLFYKNKQILEDFDEQLNNITDPALDILDEQRDDLVDDIIKKWFSQYPFLKDRKYCMQLERAKDEETFLFELYGITYMEMVQNPNIFDSIKSKAAKHLKASGTGKRKEKPNRSKEKDVNYEQKPAGV